MQWDGAAVVHPARSGEKGCAPTQVRLKHLCLLHCPSGGIIRTKRTTLSLSTLLALLPALFLAPETTATTPVQTATLYCKHFYLKQTQRNTEIQPTITTTHNTQLF
jgi:hypothetical protein